MREFLPKPELSADNLTLAEERSFEILSQKRREAAINMDRFENVRGYGKERIRGDKERAKKKKMEIKEQGKEPTRKAKLLEMILNDQIELSEWFGPNTFTIIPSEYDDLFHGVDLALEIEEESTGMRHLALGVDATSSKIKMRDKIRKIKEHIANGTLTAMEYFHCDDHNPDFYGTMENIPQVVVGADGKTIKELSELWIEAFGLTKSMPNLSHDSQESIRKRIKAAKEKLAAHRAQFLLLEEVKIQLVVFKKFAIQKSNDYHTSGELKKSKKLKEIADKFEVVLNLIDNILKEKGVPSPDDVFRNNEDPIFNSLREALDDFVHL